MSALLAYSDEVGPSRSRRCECGNRKSSNAEACERCTFLDGNKNAGKIISVLRGTDGLSIGEICRTLGLAYRPHANGGMARSIQRAIAAMFRQGRVRRYWRDGDQQNAERPVFGSARHGNCGGAPGCWVYALNAETVVP